MAEHVAHDVSPCASNRSYLHTAPRDKQQPVPLNGTEVSSDLVLLATVLLQGGRRTRPAAD